MNITFWGTRGSVPSPGPSTIRYGGNTTCLEVCFATGETIIIDAGTGIRQLGYDLMKRMSPVSVSLLFTHAHWDHVQGFPFFIPAFIAGNHIDIFGSENAQRLIQDSIFEATDSSFFPVKKDDFKANCIFHLNDQIVPIIKNGSILTIRLNHPGSGYGYRFNSNGKSFVFLTDFEIGKYYEDGCSIDDLEKFAQGCDLLVMDAQYTDDEIVYTRGWGHSTFNETVDFAIRTGVKKLVLFHHDPKRSDDELDHITAEIRIKLASQKIKLEVLPAREGETISI
ncbi:MAG: MBL fold metallo-hydrolase [bacterium]|nr:MBL fold metallo-hydrolase [bacterium]